MSPMKKILIASIVPLLLFAVFIYRAFINPRMPDQLEAKVVEVPINVPTPINLTKMGGTMSADMPYAESVQCFITGPGDEPRRALIGHYTEYNNSIPVKKNGKEYHVVGRLPFGPGKAVVECMGPDATELTAKLHLRIKEKD